MDQNMNQDEIDEAYSEYIKEQLRIDIETEDTMIRSIEKEMWTIHRELKSRKDSPSWKKMGFFKDWLKSILELANTDETNKPAEPTIAYLTETNAYLTRKLSELESGSTCPQTQDPVTQATPMASNTHLLWPSVTASTPKTPQPTNPKPTKTLHPHTPTQEPMADPCCLIIQITPTIPVEERPNGIMVRKKINDMLEIK